MESRPKLIDFFEYMRNYIGVSRIEVDNCLLINYQCWETGSDRVWFKESHFVFILSGEKRWEFNGQFFDARQGDVVFIKQGSGTVHHSNSKEFCALILFLPHTFIANFLTGNTVRKKNKSIAVPTDPLISLGSNVILEGFRNSLLSYLTDSTIDQGAIARVKLTELLQYIFSQQEFSPIGAYLEGLIRKEDTHLKAIMEGHFMLPLGLDQFAGMCNMSLSTFKRKFKEVYGEKPGAWLIEQRLALSIRLLKTSDRSVADISDAVGFNSSTYFVRAFSKKMKVTPLQFRNTQ